PKSFFPPWHADGWIGFDEITPLPPRGTIVRRLEQDEVAGPLAVDENDVFGPVAEGRAGMAGDQARPAQAIGDDGRIRPGLDGQDAETGLDALGALDPDDRASGEQQAERGTDGRARPSGRPYQQATAFPIARHVSPFPVA